MAPLADRMVALNKRDPSGLRSDEDAQASEMRRIISDGIARATASIINREVTDPVEVDVILSKEIEGDTQSRLLISELKSVNKTVSKSMTRTDRLLGRMGIELGPQGIDGDVVSAIEVNVTNDVKSLTASARAECSRAITDAIGRGLGTKDMGKMITEATGESRNRAETIARTTMAKTFNDIAVNRYQRSGVTEYNIYPTKDGRLCEKCMKAALDGNKFRRYTSPPPLPIHPNCRCIPYPIIPGEDSDLEFSAYILSPKKRIVAWLEAI